MCEEKIISKSIYELYKNGELSTISDQQIINQIGMAEMPEIAFYLWKKYDYQISLIPIDNDDVMIRVGDKFNMANMSYLAVTIHFISIKGKTLIVEGETSYPTVVGDSYEFVVKNCDCKSDNTVLSSTEKNKVIDEFVYEKREWFRTEIPLQDYNEICFYNVVGGMECRYGKINSMRFSCVADVLENQYSYSEGYIIEINDGKLLVHLADDIEVQKYEQRFQDVIREKEPDNKEMLCNIRNDYYREIKNKKRPIWIFMDRASQGDDNAEVLFKYIQNYKNIDSYFVIDKNSSDYSRISKIGKVLSLYSYEHLLKVLLADYIISSQSNGVIENPFWDDAEYVRDLYHNAKIVFLQHGVIKDDMSPTLNREETNFYGFVTSTKDEWKSIIDYPYDYTEKEVWLTGLPRFDELYHNEEKIILIMPSWRKGLMEQVWDDEQNNMVWKTKKDVEQTDFYRNYRKLFTDIKLYFLCKLHGYKVVFYPHPLLKEFSNKLLKGAFVNKCDEELKYKDIFAKAELLITDYSSVAFDFAYLKKPILYYQFDKEEFFKTHTYKVGYFDYERDGFGKVCNTEKELYRAIKELINNKMSMDDKYNQRIINTFEAIDRNNCERVIKKIEERGKKEC